MRTKEPVLTILTQSPELSRSIALYFRYKHRMDTGYSTYTGSRNHEKGGEMMAVQNEVSIYGKIHGVYPFWHHWGIRQNKRVYCLTYGKTDLANNIINWRDILAAPTGRPFNPSPETGMVPHFETSRKILYPILKPHGGASLFDLAAGLQLSLGNISGKLGKRRLSARILERIKQMLLIPGSRTFMEFQALESQYHSFISYLPGAENFFSALDRIKDILSHLLKEDNGEGENSLPEAGLFQRLEQTVAEVYGFFLPLEAMIPGGVR